MKRDNHDTTRVNMEEKSMIESIPSTQYSPFAENALMPCKQDPHPRDSDLQPLEMSEYDIDAAFIELDLNDEELEMLYEEEDDEDY